MRLTPDLLASAYDLLRHTKPFEGWNLPEAEDIRFEVLRTRKLWGDCALMGDGRNRIRLSSTRHTRLTTVLATMAHEMIHLHLDRCGAKDSSDHGVAFRQLRDKVCRVNPEFDPETF